MWLSFNTAATYQLASYAAYTLNSFDDQERNLTFVKADFKLLILKFHACNFKAGFLFSSQTTYHVVLTMLQFFYTSFLFDTWLLNLHV